ncbi:MAG: hypothetical protein A2293_10800 [Elusimicrobia bacterium RIFOXYB2_FULL_49_7]|nr:MAG: hypothetical protein A2293_10800 [Elusimicrobia bacterium RIFOXYB2_FULL_49_7]
MKSSFSIKPHLFSGMEKPFQYDCRDLDNPLKTAYTRLKYLDRLFLAVRLIEHHFTCDDKTRVAELGCAQGNLSLMLAEKGYNVTAVDINPDFIAYGRLKQEKGSIHWRVGDFMAMDFSADRFDVIFLGEVIEHCAFPEDVILKLSDWLKPGGLLILTTPNGSNFSFKLPQFETLWFREKRKKLQEKQFGPEAKDHLFLFTKKSITWILTNDLLLEQNGYCGGSPFYNRIAFLFRFFPESFAMAYLRLLAKMPFLNRLTESNLYLVARKYPLPI